MFPSMYMCTKVKLFTALVMKNICKTNTVTLWNKNLSDWSRFKYKSSFNIRQLETASAGYFAVFFRDFSTQSPSLLTGPNSKEKPDPRKSHHTQSSWNDCLVRHTKCYAGHVQLPRTGVKTEQLQTITSWTTIFKKWLLCYMIVTSTETAHLYFCRYRHISHNISYNVSHK